MKYKNSISILSVIVLACSLLSGCQSNSPENSAQANSASYGIYLEKAQEYIDAGDYDNAVRILGKAYDTTGSERIRQELERAIEAQLNAGDGSSSETVLTEPDGTAAFNDISADEKNLRQLRLQSHQE